MSAADAKDGRPRRAGTRAGASRPDRSLVPVAVVYVLLVAVPSLLIWMFLDVHSRAEGVASASAGGAPTSTSAQFARLLLAMAVILAACALVGAILRRLGQPSVLGEIAVGVVMGPSVLGAVWPEAVGWLFPADIMPTLGGLAQLGAILFVFVAGMELDTRLVRTRSSVAIVVSHVSIALPFLIGVLLATTLHGRLAPAGVGFVPFALFLGVSMSVTALPVMVRILQDLQMTRSEVGTIALTCALVDDVTAWSLLALVVAFATLSSSGGFVLTVTLAIAFTLLLVAVVRPLLHRLASARSSQAGPQFLSVVLCLLLLCALATERIGVHAIFGAFLLGIVCPHDAPPFEWARERIGPLSTALLLPFFFVYSGLRTEFGLLGPDPGLWLWCLAILTLAILGKLGGSAVAARAVGMDWTRSLQVGALMNCRGLTELVVLNIGLDLGVLSPTLFTMLVVMALITTAMTSPMLRWLQRRVGERPSEPAPRAEAALAPGSGSPAH